MIFVKREEGEGGGERDMDVIPPSLALLSSTGKLNWSEPERSGLERSGTERAHSEEERI